MAQTTVSRLTTEVSSLLAPLGGALAGPEQAEQFVRDLGWELPPGAADIGLAGLSVANLVNKALILARSTDAEWDDEILIVSRVAAVTIEIGKTVAAVKQVMDALPALPAATADYLARTHLDTELAPRILHYTVAIYLRSRYHLIYQILKFAGVVEVQDYPADPANFQTAHQRTTLNFDRIGALFDSDRSWAGEVYGWGTSSADLDKLLRNTADLLQAVGATIDAALIARELEEAVVGHSVPEAVGNPATGLMITLLRALAPDTMRAGLIVMGLRPTTIGGTDAGLATLPFVTGSLELIFPLPTNSGRWSLVLAATVDLAGGVVLSLRPGGIAVQSGLFSGGAGSLLASGNVAVGVRYQAPAATPQVLLSIPGGTKIEVEEVQIRGGAEFGGDGPSGFGQLILKGAKITISLSEGDGFLSTAIPLESLVASLDLDLLYSQTQGLRIRGSGGIEVTIGIHESLGPITLETLFIAIVIAAEGLALETSISGGLKIGPVSASVERIGLKTLLKFENGNLGPLDLGFAFKPPTGLGISVEAGPVAGGGFISFDAPNHRYSGILHLEILSVSVTVIGLIETRLPDGRDGFSFLLIVCVEFSPIQLGYGFTLNGVGGLAGIHRGMNLEALRTGVYTGSLDHILFPKDPIANAPQLISDLSRIFPVAEGQFTFGPMAKIGWGASIITISLGIVIELPSPVRIALLGQIALMLPEPEDAVIELHIDFVASIYFEAKLFALDATLRDSRIVVFALTGDMAMRLCWGDQPNFAFAMGGIHPHYPTPPGFPALRRLTLALGEGDWIRLNCQTYQAVTSNSLQFGARLELYVNVGVFIHGWFGFDALFIFSPFSFQVDFTAGLEIAVGGVKLASISVDGSLSGPKPWRVTGNAKISLLFFEISAHVDETFGDRTPATVAALDPWPDLLAAVEDARNWAGALAADVLPVVSLAAGKGDLSVLIDPAGRIAWLQHVAPLDRRLTKYKNAPTPAPVTFNVDRVTVGTTNLTPPTIDDFFPSGEFEDLTDAQKLSRPSFEKMHGGLQLTSATVKAGPGIPASIEYETRLIDAANEPRVMAVWAMPLRAQLAHVAGGAAARSALRKGGLRAFSGDRKLRDADELFHVATTDGLDPRADVTSATTKGGAYQALDAYLEAHPSERGKLQVVPLAETVGV